MGEREMDQCAAHRADQMLPRQPIHQRVLTVPWFLGHLDVGATQLHEVQPGPLRRGGAAGRASPESVHTESVTYAFRLKCHPCARAAP